MQEFVKIRWSQPVSLGGFASCNQCDSPAVRLTSVKFRNRPFFMDKAMLDCTGSLGVAPPESMWSTPPSSLWSCWALNTRSCCGRQLISSAAWLPSEKKSLAALDKARLLWCRHWPLRQALQKALLCRTLERRSPMSKSSSKCFDYNCTELRFGCSTDLLQASIPRQDEVQMVRNQKQQVI